MSECRVEAVVVKAGTQTELELLSPEACAGCAALSLCSGGRTRRIRLQTGLPYTKGERLILSISPREALKKTAFVFGGALGAGGIPALISAFFLPEAGRALVFIAGALLWLFVCAFFKGQKAEISVEKCPAD